MFYERGNLKTPLISIIIVNWNGKPFLEDCLGSLRQQSFRDFETVLVDNGSRDGSLEFVRERFPEVRTFALADNRGFAGGNNAGIAVAHGKYIALLNNDTKADPQWLARLVDALHASGDRTGMWASKILSFGSPVVIDNVGLLLYPDGTGRGKGRLEQDHGQYDRETEALLPSGCAGLYRRSMLDEIGLFDEEYFAYADDVDLGLRGRLAGWGCRFVPDAVVHHRYSASSSAYSPLKAFLVERNRLWVLWKYFPLELIAASFWYTPKRLLYQFIAALRGRGSSGRFRREQGILTAAATLLKAWCSALGGLPRILRQRQRMRGIRRMKRREFTLLLRRFELTAAELAEKE